MRGKPKLIRSDNGPEYISQQLKNWAKQHSIELAYIQPGNPKQNAYIERYNRTVRHEWLACDDFESLAEVQEVATQWLWSYNNELPHMVLGIIIPKQKLPSSSAVINAVVLESEQFGVLISTGKDAKRSRFGDVIHACFAAHLADRTKPLSFDGRAEILVRTSKRI